MTKTAHFNIVQNGVMPIIAVKAEREIEMPRETIRMNSEDNTFDIKVGWTKDMSMQIGLEEAQGRSLAWVLFGGSAERLGEEVQKAIAAGTNPEDKFTVKNMSGNLVINEINVPLTNEETGWAILNILDVTTRGPVSGIWATPSRHEVNELIRVLRRARDSAFGRDE